MKRLREGLPLIVFLCVFGWATISIAIRRTNESSPGVTVIRIGHWQLESGVRDGFNVLADEFAKLPAVRAKYGPVRVVQDAIPESIYGQWVSTQMIGGTAPDLVEVGLGLPAPIWLAYQNRYFESLTTLADEANPFNRGTSLDGIPLRNTITDGMQSGYQEELQQFMRVPLSRFTSRVFYNQDLLKRLTGLNAPPTDFRTFLETCQKIGALRDSHGERYTPIASSKYHMGMWQAQLFDPLTYSLLFSIDFNRDGWIGNDETFAGFRRGVLAFDTPAIKAKFNAMREIQQQFQPGFTGLTRDEAVFLFAQQKAVFISTGTWDAGGLIEQAKGKFTVGAMAYPQPAQDDPEYGSLIAGPDFDPANQGFMFGVTRFSKHPALAKDFLLYLASQEGNQRLNSIIGWIPSVVGLPVPPLLSDFKPVNQGMYSCFNLEMGGNTVVKLQQTYSRYQNDPSYTYSNFADDFAPFYASHGQQDWDEQQRDWQRSVLNNERFLTSMRGQAWLTSRDPDDADWIRYRAYVTARQVMPEIDHALQQRLVTQGPTNSLGPYEYRPEAIERVRRELERAAVTTRSGSATADRQP